MNELEELRLKVERYEIIFNEFSNRLTKPYICGTSKATNEQGMPDSLFVNLVLGVDDVAIYRRDRLPKVKPL